MKALLDGETPERHRTEVLYHAWQKARMAALAAQLECEKAEYAYRRSVALEK